MSNLANRPPLGMKQPKPDNTSKAALAHMRRVKSLRCVICHKPGPSDAHHCICDRYDQRRGDAWSTIPLCKECHQWGPTAIHNNKRAWIERNGADHEYLPVVADMLAGELNQ